jgi:DNA-3-methyladenine glycosylase
MADRSLPRSFYLRDSWEVAPDLLGKVIVVGRCRGRIVEVEAYGGAADAASHAYRGPTARNRPMFAIGGHLYVYFSYGMHWCTNVVTGPIGDAQAVLLRALEPLSGVEDMRARRPAARRDVDLANGPGKLSAALAIGRAHDGTDLVAHGRRHPPTGEHVLAVRIVDDGTARSTEVAVGPRIGLSKALETPWRFWVPGNRFVSR